MNYMDLIGDCYPGYGASCDGDPTVYENITWQDQPIAKADLEVCALGQAKEEKIFELSALAGAAITDGFASDALGATHTYDSAEHDQLNLIGAVAAGDSMLYSCRVPGAPGNNKAYKVHTHAQLLKVIQDGRDAKLATLQVFNGLKNTVLNAPTIAQVENVSWPT